MLCENVLIAGREIRTVWGGRREVPGRGARRDANAGVPARRLLFYVFHGLSRARRIRSVPVPKVRDVAKRSSGFELRPLQRVTQEGAGARSTYDPPSQPNRGTLLVLAAFARMLKTSITSRTSRPRDAVTIRSITATTSKKTIPIHAVCTTASKWLPGACQCARLS